MPAIILDGPELDQLLEQRRRLGIDQRDELWRGVLHMPPPPDLEHQSLVKQLTAVLDEVVEQARLGRVLPGVGVSATGKMKDDYRVPDISIVLKSGGGRARKSGIAGGPDLVVEIRSPGDETYQKLDFYGDLGVQELWVVDRDTKHVEMFRLARGKLRKSEESSGLVTSRVIPLTLQWIGRGNSGQIRVEHSDTGRSWMI